MNLWISKMRKYFKGLTLLLISITLVLTLDFTGFKVLQNTF